jgi:hypothetical protein
MIRRDPHTRRAPPTRRAGSPSRQSLRLRKAALTIMVADLGPLARVDRPVVARARKVLAGRDPLNILRGTGHLVPPIDG